MKIQKPSFNTNSGLQNFSIATIQYVLQPKSFPLKTSKAIMEKQSSSAPNQNLAANHSTPTSSKPGTPTNKNKNRNIISNNMNVNTKAGINSTPTSSKPGTPTNKNKNNSIISNNINVNIKAGINSTPTVSKPGTPTNKNKNNNIISNNMNVNIKAGINLSKIINENSIKKTINTQNVKNNCINNEGHKVKKKSSVRSTVPTLNLRNGKNSNINFLHIPKKIYRPTPMDIIQKYIALVNQAKRNRQTYTVCGNYLSVRRAFVERGWIERIRTNTLDDKEKDNLKNLESLSNLELVQLIKNRDNGEKCKRVLFSNLLTGHQVDFYWDYQTNPFHVNNDKIKMTIINRFPLYATRSYTCKIGLCESLKEAYWYYIEGYANILFPRTYNLNCNEELKMFVDDFRLTAAISLLSWVIKNAQKPAKIISPKGIIPVSIFNFAILQCYYYIKIKEHEDLDSTITRARDCEWDIYLDKFYMIMHQGHHFKATNVLNATLLLQQAMYMLERIKQYIPNLSIDGNMNLWLLKPNNGCRGCGIRVCRTLKFALDTVRQRKEVRYVVQKYIERPLLIHNTKFDIRQWFLVTCMPNLQVWLYKVNYLRFSSQLYDLHKLDESIHLTNNSVQCRYRNNAKRSNALPDQNMWHSDTFCKYLSDNGKPDAWNNIIYKGIKECIVGLFMLCQDKITTRINSFELCGADFMLGEDLRPYLIEINTRPALYASTKVTAQMCPKVLEDAVKVTVDYHRNKNASTGNFELIFKDATVSPSKDINTLMIQGLSYSKLNNSPLKEYTKTEVVAIKKKKSEELTNSPKQISNINADIVPKEVLEKPLAVSSPTKENLEKEVVAVVKKKSEELPYSQINKILNTDSNKVQNEVKSTIDKSLAMTYPLQENPENKAVAVIKKKSLKLTDCHINQILHSDPNKVRKDVKITLEKILAMIHSEKMKEDSIDSIEQHQLHRMLSEILYIISSIKTIK